MKTLEESAASLLSERTQEVRIDSDMISKVSKKDFLQAVKDYNGKFSDENEKAVWFMFKSEKDAAAFITAAERRFPYLRGVIELQD